MKKNNLSIVNSTRISSKRASTSEEIEYLEQLLQQSLNPRKRLLKAILNTLVMWGGLLLVLLLLSGIANYFAQDNAQLTSLLSISGLQEFLIASSASYALFSTYRWITTSENAYPLILQDINNALMLDETYYVQEVCRFQEPEMGGFIYFLKISEKKIFVVYDYQSQGNSDRFFLLQQSLILSYAPHCGQYVSQCFKGDPIAVSKTHSLTVPPEQWPLSNTWLILSWAEIVSTFSQDTSDNIDKK
jgi:hypothetical protein